MSEMESSMKCPVCKSTEYTQLYPEYYGTCITSDHMIIEDCGLDNRLCLGCGLVFNASGVRHRANSFYKDSYRLMTFSSDAEIKSFSGNAPKSQSQRSCDEFLDIVELPERARVLEVGAGKGLFSAELRKRRPDIVVEAFEPSSAYEELRENLEGCHVEQCDYYRFQGIEKRYDAIVSLGVLEHVANPLDLLHWKRERLRENGSVFIRVPDFESNPSDLFTADHLSKLTIRTLQDIGKRSGLCLQVHRHAGVAVHALLTQNESEQEDSSSVIEENQRICRQNEDYAREAIAAVARTRTAAASDSTCWAIFGMAASSLFAPFALDIDPAEIAAYIDENESMWGVCVNGRPVIGPQKIAEMGIGHVALVISPLYHEKVRPKLEQQGAIVHVPA